jgi:hypothetical protein
MFIPVKNDAFSCKFCYWFQFPSEEELKVYQKLKDEGKIVQVPVRNRTCHFPGKIRLKDGYCQGFKHAYSKFDRFLSFIGLRRLRRRSIIT